MGGCDIEKEDAVQQPQIRLCITFELLEGAVWFPSQRMKSSLLSLVRGLFCRIPVFVVVSIPCYLHGQAGRGDNTLVDSASLFGET